MPVSGTLSKLTRGAATVLVLVILASACGWARYRADTQHTATNPFEHRITLGNLATLQTAWTSPDRQFWSEPLISGGRVVVTTPVSIYAFDATTGRQLWRRTDLLTQHDISELRQPTTGAGAVYVTNRWSDKVSEHGGYTFGATTYALDSATGNTLATYDGGGDLPPLVTDDAWLYLAATANRLDAYGPNGARFSVASPMPVLDIIGDADAVRAVSGTAVLTIPAHGCGQPTCSATRTDVIPGNRSTPTRLAENAHTVFVLHEGMLYAYARDGCGATICAAVWSSSSYMGDVDALAVSDASVYVTANGPMRVFDAQGCGRATCSPRWTTAVDPSDTVHSPVVANGALVASEYGNGLVGLAAWSASGCGEPTCAPVWSLPGSVSDRPVVSDGAIYFLIQTGIGDAIRKLTLPG